MLKSFKDKTAWKFFMHQSLCLWIGCVVVQRCVCYDCCERYAVFSRDSLSAY